MRSFGSGNQVKLPGSAADAPNVYNFNTTYDEMYKDLMQKDKALYPLYYSMLFIKVKGMGSVGAPPISLTQCSVLE